eukprot:2644926-Rhodomonas_salina.2
MIDTIRITISITMIEPARGKPYEKKDDAPAEDSLKKHLFKLTDRKAALDRRRLRGSDLGEISPNH